MFIYFSRRQRQRDKEVVTLCDISKVCDISSLAHRIKAAEPPVGDYAFRSDPMLQRSKYKKRTSPKPSGACACGHRLTAPL